MPSPATKQVVAIARKMFENQLDFEGFLAKLAPKDRVNAERRATTIDTEGGPHRAALWRRLVASLMTLAPVAKLVGKQTVQYYIPDGKYRMQVFALEDLQDGNITLYCPDRLAEAIEAGLLAKSEKSQPNICTIKGSKEPLSVEQLDSSAINPGDHVKDLVGWNRKALRITLPSGASPTQIEAAELLCAIASRHFVKAKTDDAAAKA